MDKNIFENYKKYKREIKLLDTVIDRLYIRLEEVPVVKGKVSASGENYPYIEKHVSVQMGEPKAATEIKKKIRQKELRREQLAAVVEQVERLIASLPEGIEKQIFEMVYLEKKSHRETGKLLGYSHGRITQIIKRTIEENYR